MGLNVSGRQFDDAAFVVDVRAALAVLGCRPGQRYLFSRPLEAADFERRFAANGER